MKSRCRYAAVLAISACTGILLSGCGSTESKYPTGADRAATNSDIYSEEPSIFGSQGLRIFGGQNPQEGETGIGVNSYLWRASLDTVSFMPLASADPFGGIIMTDWYAPPATPNERLKLNIVILSKKLSADGVRVSVFRQVQSRGGWADADAAPGTARQLEDAILTRARQLRVTGLEQ